MKKREYYDRKDKKMNNTQESKENGNFEITADAILVSSGDRNEIEQAKYEGKYSQDRVEYTIKFVFNESGCLVSYQYL